MNRSAKRLNPAALVEIEHHGEKSEHWVFARYPDFNMKEDESAPIRVRLDCPIASEHPVPAFVVLTVDRDGYVYVVDARFENVQIFDRQGRLLLVFGGEGTQPGAFWLPSGIFADTTDRIWIGDSYNRRVQVFRYVRASSQTP